VSATPAHPSMLPRFEGAEGQRRLADVLRRQHLLAGDTALSDAIAGVAVLVEAIPGSPSEVVITQGNADDDIYFIISGSLTIKVNGREIAIRAAGTHVGEMATIDTTARRSATAIAREAAVLARVSQSDFSKLAQHHPDLWRRVAVDIANRLRERIKQIRAPHNQPVVFIGSSSEQLKVAQEIQLGLSHDPMVVSVWTDGIFKASRTIGRGGLFKPLLHEQPQR